MNVLQSAANMRQSNFILQRSAGTGCCKPAANPLQTRCKSARRNKVAWRGKLAAKCCKPAANPLQSAAQTPPLPTGGDWGGPIPLRHGPGAAR